MSNYDERLLESAPAATRAERQQGYNVDLLETPQKHPRSGSSSPTPPPALAPDASHAENGAGTVRDKEFFVPDGRTTPWYKTKKWIIIFVLLAIAALAAIIGGAVGGTLSHKHKNNNNSASGSGSSGDQSGGVGGQAGSSSSSSSPGGGGIGGSPVTSSSASPSGITFGGLPASSSPSPTLGIGGTAAVVIALPTVVATGAQIGGAL